MNDDEARAVFAYIRKLEEFNSFLDMWCWRWMLLALLFLTLYAFAL